MRPSCLHSRGFTTTHIVFPRQCQGAQVSCHRSLGPVLANRQPVQRGRLCQVHSQQELDCQTFSCSTQLGADSGETDCRDESIHSKLVRPGQGRRAAVQLFSFGLHWHLPRLRAAPVSRQGFAGKVSGITAESLSAINIYTGERMSQLSLGSRHLNPFTEIIWKRGSRRWLGLRKGRYVRLERPAPWLLGIPLPPPLLDPSLGLEMQQHLSDVRQQFTELPQRLSEVPQRLSEAPQQLSGLRHHLTTFIRHHMTAPNLLIMAAVVAGLLLVVLLLRNMLQKQRRKRPQPQEDPEVLARKAASLEQQRSRFRRALGGEDELPAEPSFSAVSTSQDQTVSDKGLDDFDAWDADTQKQWKRFMKSSRSQEIDEEQWWDIDRDELPADRHVYQDFD